MSNDITAFDYDMLSTGRDIDRISQLVSSDDVCKIKAGDSIITNYNKDRKITINNDNGTRYSLNNGQLYYTTYCNNGSVSDSFYSGVKLYSSLISTTNTGCASGITKNIYAVKSFNKTFKQDCCLGTSLYQAERCASCWALGDSACDDVLYNYCVVESGQTNARLFNDPKCIEWIKNQKTYTGSDIYKKVCIGANLEIEGCKSWCSKSENNCDVALKSYCDTLTIDNKRTSSVCSCFLPDSFYTTLLSNLKSKINVGTYYDKNIALVHTTCASGSIRKNADKNNMKPYECVKIPSVDNTGLILNGIELITNNICGFTIINNLTGNTGSTSNTGSTGGSTGTNSNTGSTGTNSNTGSTGSTGTNSNTGSTGSTGTNSLSLIHI